MNSNSKQGKAKPSQNKSVNKSQTRPRRKPSNLPQMGGGGAVGIANAFVAQRATYINRASAPFHPKFGKGVAVTGRQYLTSVITTGTDNQLFSGNSPSSINVIYLNPDALNGRLALEARTYQRYRFTKVRLIYTPRVATTQAGEFAIGYYADGAADQYFTPSFTATQEAEESFVSSFHNGGHQLIYDIDIPQGAQDSYYCEISTVNAASLRQTLQGLIIGFPDTTSIGAVTMGSLAIEYECFLYCPSSDLGFSFLSTRLRSREEKEAVEDFLKQYRIEKEKGVDDIHFVSSAPPPSSLKRSGGGFFR